MVNPIPSHTDIDVSYPHLNHQQHQHQLVDGSSRYNPTICSVSPLPIVINWCRISSIRTVIWMIKDYYGPVWGYGLWIR